MADTTQTTTSPAASDAESRLSKAEADLNKLESKLKRDAKLTFFVALIALGLMTAYFWYGYTQFSELLQPKTLVNVAVGLIDENIEPARKGIEAEIDKQAPVVAQRLSDQGVEAIPKIREQLEDYIIERSTEAVDQVVNISTDQFDGILSQHRPEIEALIKEMKVNENASDEVMAALQEAVNQELGRDMEANAGEVLDTLNQLTYRAERLSKGDGLSKEEQTIRLAGMIIRRMQLEGADPNLKLQGVMSSPIRSESAANAAAGDDAPAKEEKKMEEPKAEKKPEDAPKKPAKDAKPADTPKPKKETAPKKEDAPKKEAPKKDAPKEEAAKTDDSPKEPAKAAEEKSPASDDSKEGDGETKE